MGFATAAQLSAVRDAVVSALKVAGGRYEQMALLFRNAADTFAEADHFAVSEDWVVTDTYELPRCEEAGEADGPR